MTKKGHALTTGIVFTVVFILHGLRLIYGWEAVIGSAVIPMWVSWLAVLIAAPLAYYGYKYGKAGGTQE